MIIFGTHAKNFFYQGKQRTFVLMTLFTAMSFCLICRTTYVVVFEMCLKVVVFKVVVQDLRFQSSGFRAKFSEVE